MRIVLDTNVLVRANIKAHGPARDPLLRIAYSDHILKSKGDRALIARPAEAGNAHFAWLLVPQKLHRRAAGRMPFPQARFPTVAAELRAPRLWGRFYQPHCPVPS
jgi:hypothetical protein